MHSNQTKELSVHSFVNFYIFSQQPHNAADYAHVINAFIVLYCIVDISM